ncbi:peptidylprolyl isomerase SurA [Moritella viscosa]|uniref:Chaperone SurA n=1 Tax=Moritella viscosa TaxID=80854 RepID=A0A1L0BAM0_9GAMM|nr:peptidylprolyl isomerase SurA [Moritella viscosa]SGY99164.1 Survival protein surA [Moritella viscosa]
MIKKVIKILLSGVIVVTSWQAQAELTKLDEVIAIVNEEVILASDVNTLTSSVTKRATKAGQTLPSQKILTQQALDKLIIDSLQLQMAKKMGMRISNAQLDDTLNNIAKSNNQTVEQLRQNVLADGGNFNDYKEELRVQLLTNEVQRMQMRRRITISDQDVDNLLAIINEQGQKNLQYRVSHIMLRVPNDADNATMEALQTKITDIQTQLNAGKEFSNLALAVSAGPKALDGGDWGWMNINEMPTLFAEAVTNAKKGDIIGPIRSGAGLHIIKITDMRGVETVLTKEVNARHILVKPSVILSDDKARSLLNGYLARIKSGDADFAELAKAYSDDTGSAVKGGELGWADPNIYVPVFKLALKDLKKGEISPAFRSSHGWHIVQLLDRRTQDTTDKANRQKAWQLLYNRRAAEESQAWLNELKQEAYIRILDNES